MSKKVDRETVERIAKLAKLSFDQNEKEEIETDMNKMLGLIDKLNELDTDSVLPLIHVSEEVNSLREDSPSMEITQKDALKNAPKKDSDYFKVPKVIE